MSASHTDRRSQKAQSILGRVGCAVAVTLLFASRLSAAEPVAYSFQNPLHPRQCDRAIHFSERRLANDQASIKWRMVLAEGFLCKGLEDDPWALEAAISLFREIVAEQPSNVFARLELADALRKQFPLSDEAEQAVRGAGELLEKADVGAARESLVGYVDQNAAALAAQRARAIPSIENGEEEFANGAEWSEGMSTRVSILTQMGPDGLARAERDLSKYLAVRGRDALAMFYQAEVLRGRILPARSQALYAAIEPRLCHPAAGPLEPAECSVARLRLKQMAPTILHPADLPAETSPASVHHRRE